MNSGVGGDVTSASQLLPPRRKWLAIAAATALATVSYWAVVIGFAAPGGPSSFSAGSFALGLGLAPFSFLLLAFLSNHRSAPVAVLAAMGLFLVVGAPVLAATNPILGLVAGYGAGAVATLRRDEPHGRRPRVVAVAIAVVLVWILTAIAPPVGIALAPAFPFTAVGLADLWSER